jgi:hypothetical protein
MDPHGGGTFYGAVSYQSAIGRLELAEGNEKGRSVLLEAKANEGEEATASSPDPDALYRLAAIEASLGESEMALAHLRTASDMGWIDYRSLALDPRFDGVRGLAGYKQVIDEMTARVVSLRQSTPQNNDKIK